MLLLHCPDLWIVATKQLLIIVSVEVECPHIILERSLSGLQNVVRWLESLFKAEIDLVSEVKVA